MKSSIVLTALLFSMNAFATGGFVCEATITSGEDKTNIQISASTAHAVGNPLLSGISISVDGTLANISKKQVVGYWGEGAELKLNVVDPQAEYSVIVLNYNKDSESGELVLDYGEIVAKTNEVSCIFE